VLKCPTHPRYKAMLKPRVACEDCWNLFYIIDRIRTIKKEPNGKKARSGSKEVKQGR